MNRTTPLALVCLGVVGAAAILALAGGSASTPVIELRVSTIGLLGLAAIGTRAARRLGDALAPSTMTRGSRESSLLAFFGFIVATGAMTLDTLVQLQPSFSSVPTAWYVFGPVLEFAGYTMVAMAVFAVVHEMPRSSLRSSVPARTSSTQERVRRLVLLGVALFVMGPLLAFTPVYRSWGLPYTPGLSGPAMMGGWQDAIFPYRIPGILAWLAGTSLLVLAGLLSPRDGRRQARRRQTRAIQVLLVAGLVLAAGFAAEVIASTPPAYVVLIPAGRVLRIESSGGDPLAYFFNVTTTTGHVTGSWRSNDSIMSVFLNGDYPTDTRGECPPPSPPTYGPLAMNGTLDEYFPPVWHAELTWFCAVPPATITITTAVVVSFT